jgi:hypothetical protein
MLWIDLPVGGRVQVTWATILSIASPAIALVSVFLAYRSSRIAHKSLDLTFKTGQVTYEAATAGRMPSVTLLLTEVEYRGATEPEPSRFSWAVPEVDADSLEVVIRGRLVNNIPHEVLLTCWDHPACGRTTWYRYRNQSVFLIGGVEVELGRAILSEKQEAPFMWIDRRPSKEWINIHNLHTSNLWNDPELRIPRLTLPEIIYVLLCRDSLDWARRNKVQRSGFRLVCEPRTMQRVATIWQAEVVKTPVETSGRDGHNRITFGERIGTVRGPVDDSVVHYRVGFDSTLAVINTPKRRRLAGRGL